MKTVQIKRGNGRLDVILKDGEMAFDRVNKCFYIGDGKTSMLYLKAFNGVVESDNGQVYCVRVDENGVAEARPAIFFKNDVQFNFHTN